MTIFRANHDKQNPYVILDKKIINNPNLSFKAKGILTYLLSKPPGWQVRISDIQKHSTDGRESIISGLRELENAGYFSRVQKRDQSGRFTKSKTDIYEDPGLQVTPDLQYKETHESSSHRERVYPETENPITDFPLSDSPNSDSPFSENPSVLINKLENNKKQLKNSINNNLSEYASSKTDTHTQIQITTLPDQVLMPQEGMENNNKSKTYQLTNSKGLKGISRQEEQSLKKTNIPAAQMSSNFDNIVS